MCMDSCVFMMHQKVSLSKRLILKAMVAYTVDVDDLLCYGHIVTLGLEA